MHETSNKRPSESTRHWGCPPPPPLSPARVIDCSHRHALGSIARAMDEARPLLIRMTEFTHDTTALLCAWESHLGSGATFKAVTPLTEGARRTLLQAWTCRGLSIQHDLDEDPSVANPVVDFLRAHPRLKQSSMWSRIEELIEMHSPVARRPAFINGPLPSTTSTHQDGYDSVAFVLAGEKTFYIAPPHLVHPTRRGHESTASPFTPGSPAEQMVPQPFVEVRVPAGCLLFLPRDWWHFVTSAPKTIMICAWACA